MAAKLVAEEGLLKELVLSLEEGDHWVIGRDPDSCQLLVEDPTASRKHALCRRTPEGVFIENLSSSNPTLVNDEEVTAPRLLHNGDSVKIGDTTFRFYSDPSAQLFVEDAPETTKDVPSDGQPGPQNNGERKQNHHNGEEKHDSIFEETDEKHPGAQVNFDLIETGRWLLKVVGGPNNGAEFSMQTGNTYVIGTDPNACDIVFHDKSVSRQHARITVNPDDTLTIEDLKSRNGTRIDGEIIQGKHPLAPHSFVTMGTSSFVVYDREGEMQTIISPLLPSIVKVLQQEEPKAEAVPAVVPKQEAPPPPSPPPPPPAPKSSNALGAFIVIGIIMGLFAIIGIGVSTLFHQEPVVVEKVVDTEGVLKEALQPFPGVKYSFNKTTGRLLLVGHVLTSTDKNQMLYNLQGLTFIKDVDESGVIIDEYVWSEANQVLSKNPDWRGVTIHSPVPGRFVLSGYLKTRSQGEQVWDYLTRNFNYLDLLENRIIIEENVLAEITEILHSKGFLTVQPSLSNGELTLKGNIPEGSATEFEALTTKFREIQGVRKVNDFVSEVAREEAVINISDKYFVTGSSATADGTLSVIINGRILSKGDILDGMKITNIQPHAVLLEKDGVRYRIDISR